MNPTHPTDPAKREEEIPTPQTDHLCALINENYNFKDDVGAQVNEVLAHLVRHGRSLESQLSTALARAETAEKENEDLKQVRAGLCRNIFSLEQHRDSLRAEVKRLTKERDNALATNGQLSAELHKEEVQRRFEYDEGCKLIDSLRAEVERLTSEKALAWANTREIDKVRIKAESDLAAARLEIERLTSEQDMSGTRWQGLTARQAVEKVEARLAASHERENQLQADRDAARLALDEAEKDKVRIEAAEGAGGQLTKRAGDSDGENFVAFWEWELGDDLFTAPTLRAAIDHAMQAHSASAGTEGV